MIFFHRAWPACLVLLLLIGCSSVETGDQVWTKPGATDRERAAALAAAESQAQQAGPATTEQQRKDIVVTNMTAQGWRLAPKNSAP